MNPYGFWNPNPKGTSNSEYGKFNYYSSMRGQGAQQTPGNYMMPSGTMFPWAQQQQGHQHYPGCQHYQGGQQYTNAGQNWGQAAAWNQNQGNDGQGEQPNFTFHVGEEAVKAALGGQNIQFAMPQGADGDQKFQVMQPQAVQVMQPQAAQVMQPQVAQVMQPQAAQVMQPQAAQVMQPQAAQVKPTESMMSQEKNAQSNNIETETTQAQSEQSADNPSGVDQSGDGVQSTAAAYSQPTQQPETVAVQEALQPQPVMMTMPQQAKQAMWKGIPRTGKGAVNYGRTVPPTFAHPYQVEMQKMGLMSMPTLKPQRQLQMRGTTSASAMTGQWSVPSPSAAKSATGVPSGNAPMMNKPYKPKPQTNLCGKCSKCKTLAPPSEGIRPTLTFPAYATQTRKPTTRSMHNLGQDAKNFRAIRFN